MKKAMRRSRYARRGASIAIGWLLTLASPSIADDPLFYLRLVEPDPATVPDRHVHCADEFRFEVLCAHEQDGLNGMGFALTVIDENHTYLPLDASFRFDRFWECGGVVREHPQQITAFYTCIGMSVAAPASGATLIGELTVSLPPGFDGTFQAIFLEPIIQEEPIEPWVDFNHNKHLVQLSPSGPYRVHCPAFIRGDANDDGAADLSDAVRVLNVLFLGTGEVRCEDAADANDSGVVDISDPIYLLTFLFLDGPPLPPPYPEIGSDPTEDELECPGLHPAAEGK